MPVDLSVHIYNVPPAEYEVMFRHPVTVFDRVDFAGLNRCRADEVEYLAFVSSDGTPVMGWIAGRQGDKLMMPFSAPYSMPAVVGNPSYATLVACCGALRDYCRGTDVKITLPADFYSPAVLHMLRDALMATGAEIGYSDFNYHVGVVDAADIANMPRRTARQEMRRVLSDQQVKYEILDAADDADIARAYHIISENHTGKGYPVKMSLSQVTDTIKMLGGLVSVVTYGGNDAAAQLGYFSAGHVYQPVYWGDLAQWSAVHPMKALFYNLCAHLRGLGFDGILDLGPSSEFGVPSPGLCAFKESLGCILSMKTTLFYR